MANRKQVLEIISHAIDVDTKLLTDDVSIGDLPEWDSIGNLAIITAIEQELQIEIPLEDLFELTSIGSIIEEVDKLVKDD